MRVRAAAAAPRSEGKIELRRRYLFQRSRFTAGS